MQQRYRAGTNLVLLAPDVAKAFANNTEAVNEALTFGHPIDQSAARQTAEVGEALVQIE